MRGVGATGEQRPPAEPQLSALHQALFSPHFKLQRRLGKGGRLPENFFLATREWIQLEGSLGGRDEVLLCQPETAEDSPPVDHDYRHIAWGRRHPRNRMCVHTQRGGDMKAIRHCCQAKQMNYLSKRHTADWLSLQHSDSSSIINSPSISRPWHRPATGTHKLIGRKTALTLLKNSIKTQAKMKQQKHFLQKGWKQRDYFQCHSRKKKHKGGGGWGKKKSNSLESDGTAPLLNMN